MILKLKGVAAVLLIISMSLPLSRCSGIHLTGKNASPTYTYQYALSNFRFTDISSWITLFAYFWPLGAFVYHRISESRKKWLLAIEIVLSLGSGFWIWFIANFLSQMWIGGWIALFAIILYCMLTALSFRTSPTSDSS